MPESLCPAEARQSHGVATPARRSRSAALFGVFAHDTRTGSTTGGEDYPLTNTEVEHGPERKARCLYPLPGRIDKASLRSGAHPPFVSQCLSRFAFIKASPCWVFTWPGLGSRHTKRSEHREKLPEWRTVGQTRNSQSFGFVWTLLLDLLLDLLLVIPGSTWFFHTPQKNHFSRSLLRVIAP